MEIEQSFGVRRKYSEFAKQSNCEDFDRNFYKKIKKLKLNDSSTSSRSGELENE